MLDIAALWQSGQVRYESDSSAHRATVWEDEGPMPTRNRSTTDSGRGELDEADLVADAGNACILQFSHLATLRARKSGRSRETGLLSH